MTLGGSQLISVTRAHLATRKSIGVLTGNRLGSTQFAFEVVGDKCPPAAHTNRKCSDATVGEEERDTSTSASSGGSSSSLSCFISRWCCAICVLCC